MPHTSARVRLLLAILAIVIGLFLVSAAPKLITFFFPSWGALCVVAGAATLVLAYPIYRGERWARPAAVGLLTIPLVKRRLFEGTPSESKQPQTHV